MAAWQKPVGSMRLRPPELDHGGASRELTMQLRRCGIGKFHQAAIGGFYTRRRSVSWEEKARRGLDNAATRGGARCGYPCSAAGGPGRARRRAEQWRSGVRQWQRWGLTGKTAWVGAGGWHVGPVALVMTGCRGPGPKEQCHIFISTDFSN
jgi:hypothetical protein